MTTARDTDARTRAELLYLSVDVGDRPSLGAYQRNVAALLELARYASFVRSREVLGTPRFPWLGPEAGPQIVRISMASPWVTVLGDLARTSAPVAYGVTTLYALHRLLQMVMTWQRHRLDIAERQAQLEQLRSGFWGETRRIATEAHPSHAKEVTTKADDLERQVISRFPPPDRVNPRLEQAMQAGLDLGAIQAAEMIASDDPRATGEPEPKSPR